MTTGASKKGPNHNVFWSTRPGPSRLDRVDDEGGRGGGERFHLLGSDNTVKG